MSNVPEGSFVYRGVQKINLFTFCHFNVHFTIDGACSLYMSFQAWPEIAKLSFFFMVTPAILGVDFRSCFSLPKNTSDFYS